MLRWAPDFADRAQALELALIDAAAPWPVNLACNAAINQETKSWDAGDLLERCRSLLVPALLLHGEGDPRPPFAIADLVEAIPSADVKIIENAGHLPWLERPGAIAAVTRAWLSQVT